MSEQASHAEQVKTTTALRELEQLRNDLSIERDLREKAEEKALAANEALQKESVSRLQAQMVAKERSQFANTQEVPSSFPFFKYELMKGPISSKCQRV